MRHTESKYYIQTAESRVLRENITCDSLCYLWGTLLDKHINWRKAIFSIIEPRSRDREGLARTPRGELPRQTYKVGEWETVTVCPRLSAPPPSTPLFSLLKHDGQRFPSKCLPASFLPLLLSPRCCTGPDIAVWIDRLIRAADTIDSVIRNRGNHRQSHQRPSGGRRFM